MTDKPERYRQALELIAAPVRADGTYNRSREACEQLARETLNKEVLNQGTSKATEADVEKFMNDNKELMDDLAAQEERDKASRTQSASQRMRTSLESSIVGILQKYGLHQYNERFEQAVSDLAALSAKSELQPGSQSVGTPEASRRCEANGTQAPDCGQVISTTRSAEQPSFPCGCRYDCRPLKESKSDKTPEQGDTLPGGLDGDWHWIPHAKVTKEDIDQAFDAVEKSRSDCDKGECGHAKCDDKFLKEFVAEYRGETTRSELKEAAEKAIQEMWNNGSSISWEDAMEMFSRGADWKAQPARKLTSAEQADELAAANARLRAHDDGSPCPRKQNPKWRCEECEADELRTMYAEAFKSRQLGEKDG